MREATQSTPRHCSNEQTGPENAACITGGIGRRSCDDLQQYEQRHETENHFSIQRVPDVDISDAKHFGYEKTHDPDNQSANRRLQPDGPYRQYEKSSANPKQQFHKRNRYEAADSAQNRVDAEFGGMNQVISRYVEQRLIPQK